MNTTFQKKQYNGFGLNDTLLSRISFSGILRCSEIQKRTIFTHNDEIPYWVVRDEFGARLSCFDKHLSERFCPGEVYKVSGEVKIGKGGTFLNLKDAEVFCGRDFTDTTEQ